MLGFMCKRLFADGGDGGAGAGTSAASAPTQGTPTVDLDKDPIAEQYRQKRAKKENKYKSADNIPGDVVLPEVQHPASAEAEAPKDRKAVFDELIKGEYKDLYGEKMQETVKERLKNSKEAEAALSKLTPALEILFQKHGITPGDFDGLVESLSADDSLYEDEAIERGIPIETLKDMKNTERELDSLKQQAQQSAEQQFLQNHYNGLQQQVQELQQIYPGIDLDEELKNPIFARMTAPNGFVDVATAFYAVHKKELESGMAEVVAKNTAQNMSRSIQSGSKRPQETGLNPSNTANVLSNDPRNWTPEMRKKMRSEIAGGRKVQL